ncbi:LysR family transcriptional regulator [Acetobacter syzygii]|mgnify:FL=1|uniref:LysR family transcriptional regulator n=1 Tax=Acetobacter syzygii TaxID=146476 RepID=A0A270BTI0_9PROT|nr:LysR family transcriptional regulator [Acetobacter syzygii]PAL28279.1 LysR family transcriptional regulator [Acetobacter syzygii]PAL28708.1 LysR family transcriptional regulator [Acetobacter syzygii]GAN71303.1 transcriptional regulator LysR [Acetobacter syzygii]GBR63382.1 LysR family transcriptional regulator [Acetobacter syzygii NRIC 0483]GEL55185.1 LysR family transcriptional regulator [Acetobacter syzygii]
MFLRQLSYLIALDQHRHFSRAAQACGVSQPALSAAIRQLENELGITIINRNRRFFGLTEEGRRVLIWARQTVADLDSLRQEAAFAQDVAGGFVSIGVMPQGVQVVPLLLEHFRRAVPALQVEVTVYPNAEILHQLREHRIQLGLMYLDQVPKDGPFEVHRLYAEHYVLIAAPSIPLPAGRVCGWDQAAALPLGLLNRNMRSRQLVDACFVQAGVVPRVMLETNVLELLHAEILTGKVAGIMPVSALPERMGFMGPLQMRRLDPSPAPEVGVLRLNQPNSTALLSRLWGVSTTLELDDIYTV